MNRKMIWIAVLLLSCTATAQVQQLSKVDSIMIIGPRQNVFLQNDIEFDLDGMAYIVQDNAEALAYVNRARSNKSGASVTGFIGGFGLGWSLVSIIRGDDFPTIMFVGGVVFTAISIPLNAAIASNMRKAAHAHNAALASPPTSMHQRKVQWHLQGSANGLGLRATF